jgi:hypothetical protein
MAANIRNPGGMGNITNTFTIDPKRLPVFKGKCDMQVVGDFISDLQRPFEARYYEIGWLKIMTLASSGTTTPALAATEATTRTEGWTRYTQLKLKEEAGRWATSTFASS